MIRFECDYNNGCCDKVLKAIVETNDDRTPGYGNDIYCAEAADIIRKLCKKEDAAVHFISGGTQTNTIVITSVLKPYQGVISADTGHINAHETGAIEARGHKVLALENTDGKINAAQVEKYCAAHYADESFEHIVQPGMVYISNPTEIGTLYTKDELTALRKVCDKYALPLFMDGARLGYGIMAEGNDLTLDFIADVCDVFYIGGTKVGALFGEAVVITNDALKKDFRYCIKQHGAMFAKGRLLGIQFKALLEDGTYFDISEKADKYAYMIRDAFKNKGFDFIVDSPTNQQFPILDNKSLEALKKNYAFSVWAPVGDKTAVRFCTSWATTEEDVKALIADIEAL